ncbi:MAG TPA: hypothetical protein VNM67_04715 [Thermoanaerobaculia bacterium]|jgi:hypothetical protein|nr:hypothetical protein [Thermoanaerobaculia bacterium]
MRAFAAVLRRELAERWLLALAAALLGLIPLAVPFLPMGISQAPDARSGTAIALAVIVSYVLALVLGSTVLARDLSERRLGFYFSRPLPGWAIWAGKLAGAALLAFGSGVLVLLPSLLLGDRLDPSGSWGWGLGRGGDSALAFTLWVMTVLALLLAANAFSTMVRSRSPWLLLDLLAGTLLVGLVGIATARLLSAWALDALTMAHFGLLVIVVLCFAAASAVQVTRARTDARRGHRLLSLPLWTLLGLSALAFGGYAQWVLAASPEDLVAIGGMVPAPAGDWIALGGSTGKLRGEFEPFFLLDTSSGRSFRLQAHATDWGGFAFSSDGRHAAWTEMAGRGDFPVTIHRLDLGRPGAEPVATPIGFPEHFPYSLVLSPDGRRMACIVDERIVAQEMGNGRLLLATPVLAGDSWSADRLRFLDSRTLRWYGTRKNAPLQGGEGELRVVDFDLGTGRIVREIRSPGKENAIRGISPDGQSVLLKSRTLEPSREEIAIVDLRTGEPPVDILVKGVQSGLSFLPDGRVVIARRSQDRIELRVLNGRGAELKRFHLPGGRVRLGGQPAPGLLVVLTTRDSSEKAWRTVLLNLDSGALRPLGEGLYPDGWPSLPTGSIGTQLFVQKNGGLVRIDPATGRQHVILHPEN